MRKCKIFYGWIVVIGCMMLAAASTGFLSYFNALFVQQVTEDIRVSRTRYMAYATFSSLTTMIFMPFAARLFRKIPMKRLLYIGGALGVLSQIIYSVASFPNGNSPVSVGSIFINNPVAIPTNAIIHIAIKRYAARYPKLSIIY